MIGLILIKLYINLVVFDFLGVGVLGICERNYQKWLHANNWEQRGGGDKDFSKTANVICEQCLMLYVNNIINVYSTVWYIHFM